MKALVKLAIVGFIAATMQANAQSLQVQKVMQTPTGRAFLQRTLGVSAGTPAELTAAMGKLTGPQQAAVAAAIGKFNTQAVNGTSAAAISKNEEIAKSIFAQNGNLKTVTAMVADTSSREGVNTAVQPMACDAQQFATELASGTKVSYADFRAVVDAKRITNGTCSDGVTKYVANARENLGEGEVCTLNACPATKASKDCDEARYTCYAEAFSNDPGAQKVTAAQVKPTIEALRNDCHIIQ